MRLQAILIGLLILSLISCEADFEYQTARHKIAFSGFESFNFKEAECELNEHNYQDYEVCFVDTLEQIKIRLYTTPKWLTPNSQSVELREFWDRLLLVHIVNPDPGLEFYKFNNIEINYDFTEKYLLKRQVLLSNNSNTFNRNTLKVVTDITLYDDVVCLIVEKPYNSKAQDLWTEMEKLKKIRITRHGDVKIGELN